MSNLCNHVTTIPAGTYRPMFPGKDEPAEVKVERSAWYWLWGARNFDEDKIHAHTLVKEHRLKEVRLTMTNTLVDGIFSVPGALVSIVRRTIRVEGNR